MNLVERVGGAKLEGYVYPSRLTPEVAGRFLRNFYEECVTVINRVVLDGM